MNGADLTWAYRQRMALLHMKSAAMLKPTLAFDCPAIVESNVTENVQPVFLPHSSGALWTLEYPNPQRLTSGGSYNSSLNNIDADHALAFAWAQRSRTVLTLHSPERLFDTITEVEKRFL